MKSREGKGENAERGEVMERRGEGEEGEEKIVHAVLGRELQRSL